MKKHIVFLVFIGFVSCSLSFSQSITKLTEQQKEWLSRAYRNEKSGWIYLHIQGGAYERGFQHGYLLSKEIGKGLTDTKINWKHTSAMEWNWLVEKAYALFSDKIDAENKEEIQGIADGLKAAGVETDFSEMLAYNSWIELSSYWYPLELKKMDVQKVPVARESCSAFIAVGKMTSDGGIVMGHNTMTNYHEVFCNVVIDILPAKGHRILMQTVPGWIHSGTDFFVTDAGLVGCETTIGDFEGFDADGIPEFTRMRRATQDAGNIEEWCSIMKKGNNGGYANAWLLGDINTNEIARLELGLKFIGFENKKDGFFTGSNVAEDLRILRFETTTDETNIKDMAIARRVRWNQLMAENAGKLDVEMGKKFEAEHFDTFREKIQPGGRGLCCHGELESDNCGWPSSPYYPAGTMDGKVIDSKMAKQMSFAARWGSACGLEFDADKFLSQHPQYNWMKDVLYDRPSQPWAVFKSGEK
jgi:hypothetical protein